MNYAKIAFFVCIAKNRQITVLYKELHNCVIFYSLNFYFDTGACSSEDSHSGTFQVCHWEIEIRNNILPDATS